MYFLNPKKDWSAQFLASRNETEALANASMLKAPASPSPALPLSSYEGNYSNALFGPINVTAQGSGLMITAGPKRTQVFLSHRDRDTFKASMPYIPDDIGFVQFQMDPEAKAKSLTIDVLEGATFDRV